MQNKIRKTQCLLKLLSLVALAFALTKKYFSRKSAPKLDYITHPEFHEGINSTRDRIRDSYLALADKLEQYHVSLLTALERQGANFGHRLDSLNAASTNTVEQKKPLTERELKDLSHQIKII